MADELTDKQAGAPVANSAPTTKLLGGITGKGFMPGQSGNPNGRPKKTPITDLYQEILNDPANMETFKQAVIKAVNSGRMSSMFQLKEMAERVEGKVTQSLEVKTELRDMTEAELTAKLELLRKELP